MQAGFLNLNVQNLFIVVPTNVEAVRRPATASGLPTPPTEIRSFYERFMLPQLRRLPARRLARAGAPAPQAVVWPNGWATTSTTPTASCATIQAGPSSTCWCEARRRYEPLMAEAAPSTAATTGKLPTPRQLTPRRTWSIRPPSRCCAPVHAAPARPGQARRPNGSVGTEFQFLQLLEACSRGRCAVVVQERPAGQRAPGRFSTTSPSKPRPPATSSCSTPIF